MPKNNQSELANQVYAKRAGKAEVTETVEEKGLEAATARASEIINSDEAIGREELAKQLSKNPALTASDAIDILKTTPRDNDALLRASAKSIYQSRKVSTNA